MGEILRFLGEFALISAQVTNCAYPCITFLRALAWSCSVASGWRADGWAAFSMAALSISMDQGLPHSAWQPCVANYIRSGAAGWSNVSPNGAISPTNICWYLLCHSDNFASLVALASTQSKSHAASMQITCSLHFVVGVVQTMALLAYGEDPQSKTRSSWEVPLSFLDVFVGCWCAPSCCVQRQSAGGQLAGASWQAVDAGARAALVMATFVCWQDCFWHSLWSKCSQ